MGAGNASSTVTARPLARAVVDPLRDRVRVCDRAKGVHTGQGGLIGQGAGCRAGCDHETVERQGRLPDSERAGPEVE
jgi:hypothetical protein